MTGNGLIQVSSPHSVDETVKRLEAILAERGLKVFALIDHSGDRRVPAAPQIEDARAAICGGNGQKPACYIVDNRDARQNRDAEAAQNKAFLYAHRVRLSRDR